MEKVVLCNKKMWFTIIQKKMFSVVFIQIKFLASDFLCILLREIKQLLRLPRKAVQLFWNGITLLESASLVILASSLTHVLG